MGYQVVFHYHKRKDAGYDMENKNKLQKKVGKDDEDTPLEQVVMLIKSQLARRDILVTDVDVFEFVKKRVKFKEVKGGFVIKDKKFLMDQIQGVPVSDEDDTGGPPQPYLHPHERMQMPQFQNVPLQQLAQPLNVRPQVNEAGVPMPMHPQRFEVFDPDPLQQAKLGNKYRLTPGKKYGIYREWADAMKVTQYLIKDDRNMEVTISAEFFVAAGKGLIGGNFDADPVERQINRGLSFQGQFLEDRGIPVVQSHQPMLVGDDEVPPELMQMPDISQLRGRV
jgi:hypothetical protein